MQGKLGLDSLPELLTCMTANNTALRWLLLHTGRQHQGKQATAVAKQAVDQDAVIGLLLDTAALEHWVGCCCLFVWCKSFTYSWSLSIHALPFLGESLPSCRCSFAQSGCDSILLNRPSSSGQLFDYKLSTLVVTLSIVITSQLLCYYTSVTSCSQ